MAKLTIAIDFDGVIHEFSKGYADGTLYDHPKQGAFVAIKELLEHWNIFILSTRRPEKIHAWLSEWGPPFKFEVIDPTQLVNDRWTKEGVVGISNVKHVARYFIDDRAIFFDSHKPGVWRELCERLTSPEAKA